MAVWPRRPRLAITAIAVESDPNPELRGFCGEFMVVLFIRVLWGLIGHLRPAGERRRLCAQADFDASSGGRHPFK
jgi:hypothetical protein